jgi:hypothetical protein
MDVVLLNGDASKTASDYTDFLNKLRGIRKIGPTIFEHQLISYLKVSGLHVGLLINFGNIGNKSCQVKRVVF